MTPRPHSLTVTMMEGILYDREGVAADDLDDLACIAIRCWNSLDAVTASIREKGRYDRSMCGYKGLEEVGRFGAFLVFSRPQKPLKTVLLGSALSLSMPVFSQWRHCRLEKFLRCNRKRFFYVKTQTQMLCFVVLDTKR